MVSNRPMLSVVIPAYNSEAYVRKAVESVLAQTFRDFEVILVDDGSTDSTWAILLEYRAGARLLRQKNAGPSAARNAGIREARGDLIAFLDADDRWHPSKLELQLSVFRSNPEAALVGCLEGWPGLCQNPDPGECGNGAGRVREVHVEEVLLHGCRAPTSGVMIQRKVFVSVGMFDEDLRCSEDWDLWIRTVSRARILLLELPLVYKRSHPGNISRSAVRTRVDQLRVLRKARHELEGKPLPGALWRRALARPYVEAAIEHIADGQRLCALGDLAASAAAWPFSLGNVDLPPRWLLAFRAIVGNGLFGLASAGSRRLRQRMPGGPQPG